MDKAREEQFRRIAEINQQPIYFPNALGMERLKFIWAALSAVGLFVIVGTYTIAGVLRDLSDARKDVAEMKLTVEKNRQIIATYDWKVWWDQHRTMWDQRARGESNKEVFFREHGRGAPGQPEK